MPLLCYAWSRIFIDKNDEDISYNCLHWYLHEPPSEKLISALVCDNTALGSGAAQMNTSKLWHPPPLASYQQRLAGSSLYCPYISLTEVQTSLVLSSHKHLVIRVTRVKEEILLRIILHDQDHWSIITKYKNVYYTMCFMFNCQILIL